MFRIISSIVLLFVTTACLEEDPSSWPQRPFTPIEWAKTTEDARYVFVRDIVEHKVLAGKTAEEVERLLGKPSFDGLSQKEHYITYAVKTSGSSFDQVFLLDIRFNVVSNTVEKAFVRGD